MDTLVSMRVFRQVVESGSFTAAALALDMSIAMVSKHVMHLEDHVASRLLNRTSRRLSLNGPGAAYYERCCEILNQIDEAESALGTQMEEPKGTLRISAPTWFSNRFFATLLHDYAKMFPLVHLDVSLSDAIVDLVEEGLDVALRGTTKERLDPKLPARAIGALHFTAVASREYLEKHGRPRTMEDLATHQVLEYTYAPSPFGMAPPSNWRLNNTALIGELAAQGAGIAILPHVLLHQERYSEQLVTLELDTHLPTPMLFAVTHGRRQQSARVRTFVDFMAERFTSSGCSKHFSKAPELVHPDRSSVGEPAGTV